MFIEIQSFGDNYEKRQELLRKLNKLDGFSIGDKSFNPESKYTRVYSESIVVKDAYTIL